MIYQRECRFFSETSTSRQHIFLARESHTAFHEDNQGL